MKKVDVSAEARLQGKDLELAREYADSRTYFNDEFLVSLEVQFNERGYLTDKQHQALQNVMRAHRMTEWADEEGIL